MHGSLQILCLTLLGASCAGEPDAAAQLRAELAGKNVLITLIDATAAGHLQAYGYDRRTMPFLEDLAAQSVLFEDASASASFTLASVASLMTGEAPDRHLMWIPGRVLPAELPLLAETFQAAGYQTHGVSTNAHVHEKFGYARGFDRYRDITVDLHGNAPMAVPDSMTFETHGLLAAAHERPFFAYWHFLPPHAPYDPPAPFGDTFAPHADPRLARAYWSGLPDSGPALTPDELRDIIDLYDSSLTYVDSVLKEIHDELERSGLLDETLWIVLSDHGEAFGEHGVFEHGGTIQQELVHVPLLMRLPGARLGGTRIQAPVGLVDLAPTLVDLVLDRATVGGAGVSLVPLLAGGELERDAPLFFISNPSLRHAGLRRGDLKIVYEPGPGSYQLFDLAADPHETVNVGADHPEALMSLKAELDVRLEGWMQREEGRRAEQLDPEMEEQLRALGYGGEIDAARKVAPSDG